MDDKFAICPLCGDIVLIEVGFCMTCHWTYDEQEYQNYLKNVENAAAHARYADSIRGYLSDDNNAAAQENSGNNIAPKPQSNNKKLPPPNFKVKSNASSKQ